MSTRYSLLFSVEAAHGYYAGSWDGMEFAIPPATTSRMAGLRLTSRTGNGRLLILSESEEGGPLPTGAAGTTLLFGLRPSDAWFENVTAPVTADSDLAPIYANSADPDKLDAPVGVVLASGRYRHIPRSAARPLTLSLVDGQGAALAARALKPGEADAVFDLNVVPDGLYSIEEDAGAGVVAASPILADAELRAMNPWGVLRIKIDAGFAVTPPTFAIRFIAKSEPLRYYVVARNFPPAEFDELSVTDKGAGEEQRAALAFERVAPNAFGPDDLAPATLAEATASLTMFRSLAPVPRRERGYRKLQLSRNGDVLIENLPLPRPDSAGSDLVVQVSKPKL